MMRALQKGAPLSTKSGNAMPPYDKQIGTRPTASTASAPASRNVNKTPLTPRVAASNSSFALASVPRKGTRYDANAFSPSPQKEDFSTPVSTFLNNNITPRSSSRKTRGFDSTNTTPTHTPVGITTPDSLRFTGDVPIYGGAGLDVLGLEPGGQPRPTVSFSPALSEVGAQRDQSQPGGDMKFFYASDAKAAVQQPQQQRPAPNNKASSFFYANGDTIPSPVNLVAPVARSVVESSVLEECRPAKFFHASAASDWKSQPVQSWSTTNSTISNSHLSPKVATRSPASVLSHLQRPASPSKASQNSSSSALKHASNPPSPLLTRFQAAQDAVLATGASKEMTRQTSGHERSASAGVVEFSPSARRLSSAASLVPPSLSFPIKYSNNGVISSPEESLSETSVDRRSSQSELHSPVKTGHSLERMNELAANARRERKVLDLEITNSSLAAINRTLEREMRKQNAELRRYRRLSRSGRLSIATSASLRTSSGGLADGIDVAPLSDMSEESSEDECDEETSEGESPDEGSLSPGAMAESDARHRKKDEKRLQLDLSKHQQLLVDSQNMNQSLKRCLGWTEELINEGKKALAYNVHVSDIELGGRVLSLDETDDVEIEALSQNVVNAIPENNAVNVTYDD